MLRGSGIELKSDADVDRLRASNRMVADIHARLRPLVVAGVTTGELDKFVEDQISAFGATPAFKGYRGRGRVPFPGCICASVNEEVVHGIPSFKRKLAPGDQISIDIGLCFEQFYGDMAVTYVIAPVKESTKRLLEATQTALVQGIAAAQPGGRLTEIGAAILSHAKAHGYGIVRDFVGHGIGKNLHEEPQVPNFPEYSRDVRLEPGMVLAIEPMLCDGRGTVDVLRDGWTVVTRDRKHAAHYEHVVAIRENGNDVLTQIDGDWLSRHQSRQGRTDTGRDGAAAGGPQDGASRS